MKQTAVEWLNEQMNNIKGSSISMNGSVQFIEKELNNLFEQAKAMEKEQSLKMLPYDLDELAKEFAIQQLANPNEYENSVYAATIKNTYMTGFKKALELLTFKSE